MKFGVKAILGVAGMCALLLVFQNCSGSQFSSTNASKKASSLGSNGGNNGQGDGGPGSESTPPPGSGGTPGQCVANTTLISIIGTPKVAPDDGIVEINANCTSGSTVNVESGTYKGGAKCGSNNKVVVCSLLQKLGSNSVKVTQTGQSCENPDAQVITVPASTGHPVTPEPPVEITDGKVVDPSTGEVTLGCEPGAAIDATIYGNPQLAGNATCPMNGVMKFNVGLVPSLAGSGNRRVYVTQLTQSGQVNTVSTDMDNVDKKHECTIASTQANTDICVASAGSISGVCKEGTPVQVFVNGVAQRSVDCPNGSYLAQNVLLTKPGESNTITVKQKTPHGSTCEAMKSLTNF